MARGACHSDWQWGHWTNQSNATSRSWSKDKTSRFKKQIPNRSCSIDFRTSDCVLATDGYMTTDRLSNDGKYELYLLLLSTKVQSMSQPVSPLMPMILRMYSPAYMLSSSTTEGYKARCPASHKMRNLLQNRMKPQQCSVGHHVLIYPPKCFPSRYHQSFV